MSEAFDYLFNHAIKFDGSTATLYDDDGKKLGEYPATSGRDGVTDQKSSWKGPIPEGDYTLDPKEISEASGFRGWLRNLLGDWGTYRAPLHPIDSTQTYGRSGFFIHGGSTPGSAGCIDVGRCDLELFPQIKDIGHNVDVHVEYPKKQ